MEMDVHECLEKLRELGIDALGAEKEIKNIFLFLPDEVLEAMEPERYLAEILGNIGTGFYSGTERLPSEIYVFDMEGQDIERMYTGFLEGILRIAGGSLEITDIEEIISQKELESRIGTQTVRFRCNGKEYEYKARLNHDWFDAGMLAFMSKVVEEQNTGSHLYVTSDYQNCIVLYRTREWAERFRQLFGIGLESP